MKHILGIDLGTSTICVHYTAAMSAGKELRILQFLGTNNLPSMVYIQPNAPPAFGYPIKQLVGTDQTPNIVYWAKRLIGHKITDDSVKYMMDHVGFKIVPDANKYPVIQVGNEKYAPEQIAAMLLTHVKETYKNTQQHEIDECIITVPAYFNDLQRRATLRAAEIAGIKVKQLFNEPTAAALAFREETNKDKINTLIFDFGAGTLDVSIVNINGPNFNVIGVSGDSELGGNDIDQYLMDFAIDEFDRKNPGYKEYLNANKDSYVVKRILSNLRNACEQAKIGFSSDQSSVKIIVPNFWQNNNLDCSLRKKKFEDILDAHELFDKMLKPVEIAINQARLKAHNIGAIILVGGTTMLPCIKEKLAEYFSDNGVRDSEKLISTMEPLTVVSKGAAYIAQKAAEGKIIPKDQVDQMWGKHKTSGIVSINDIQPISIGIKADVDKFLKYIIAGRPLPQCNKLTFQVKDKRSIQLELYQGENKECSKNKHITTTTINNIPLGAESITIEFKINESGMLVVNASCKDNKSFDQEFPIDTTQKLSDGDVQRMMHVNQKIFSRPEQNANKTFDEIYKSLKQLRKINKRAHEKYDKEYEELMEEYDMAKDLNVETKIFEIRANKLHADIKKLLN